MAVIRNRGDHQWQAVVRKKGSPPVSKTFLHKADAERWARTIELAIERGEIDSVNQATQRITVSEAVAEYTLVKLPTLTSPSMRKVELKRIEETFGPLFIANLRSPAINQWIRDLSETTMQRTKKKPSAGTVTHHVNRLSGVIEFARRHMGVYIPENPVRLVSRPKTAPGRSRRLGAREEEYLLKCAAGSPQFPELITLALETSMRLGELLSLRWEFVDLRNRTAHIPISKNGKSRTIALSTRAVAAFNALRQPNVVEIHGTIFHWAKADSFTNTWKRLIKRAQALYLKEMGEAGQKPAPLFLEDLRFHDLRHEATSRLFEKGLGIMEVASMTGHESLTMLKRYTHIGAATLAMKLG
jgi:integrase